jgi:hypothetical protein
MIHALRRLNLFICRDLIGKTENHLAIVFLGKMRAIPVHDGAGG